MVQTNTVQGPGGEAGVMRIKGTGTAGHERGLAMALDGNGRWAYLNPKLGAMHAVAEAARKVACTGATPVAATNCLNFGNPEKPEIMAQLSAAIDGIAEACTALGTPITGGNVSLYNETRGEGIYPTPVLGIVGILDDVTKAVAAHFQQAGDAIVLLWPIPAAKFPIQISWCRPPHGHMPGHESFCPRSPRRSARYRPRHPRFGRNRGRDDRLRLLGICATPCSAAPGARRRRSRSRGRGRSAAVFSPCWPTRGLVHSARDISDGGIAVALAQAAFPNNIGARVEQDPSLMAHPLFGLFAEPASTVIVTAAPEDFEEIERLATENNIFAATIGATGGSRIEITVDRDLFLSAPLDELRRPWATAIESHLHGEVPA